MKVKQETRKKLEVIERAFQEEGRLTVRRIYYLLLSQGFYDLRKSRNPKYAEHVYQNLSKRLVDWREAGLISSDIIIDRKSEFIKRRTFKNFDEYFEKALKSYASDSMLRQERAVEVWIEKDTMRTIFLEDCYFNDVPLIISRGWTSRTFKDEAVRRFAEYEKPATVLYFGDFDFEGEHIPRVLEEFVRRKIPDLNFEFRKVLLTSDDYDSLKDYAVMFNVKKKHLEHIYVKEFIEQYGAVKLEVEALPFNETKKRFTKALYGVIDRQLVDDEEGRAEKEKKNWLKRHYRA